MESVNGCFAGTRRQESVSDMARVLARRVYYIMTDALGEPQTAGVWL